MYYGGLFFTTKTKKFAKEFNIAFDFITSQLEKFILSWWRAEVQIVSYSSKCKKRICKQEIKSKIGNKIEVKKAEKMLFDC